jgi:DNA-binding HxlR family transcriptional regulator
MTASLLAGVLFTTTVNGLLQKRAVSKAVLSSYLSAVNQKLLFARQLLSQVDAKTAQQDTALTQSVAVQLHQAWLWHCRNVAETYKLQELDAVECANTLVDLLAEQGKTPGEATELQNLQNDSQSWLSELLKAHDHVYRLPTIRKAEMDVDRLPLIAVDAPEVVDWSAERANLWLANMQELVERQREMMVEF